MSECTAYNRRKNVLPIAVDVVVERQLFVLLDRTVGEDAHPDVVPDSPLRDIAVGITAMVSESTDTATLRGVDVLGTSQQGRA